MCGRPAVNGNRGRVLLPVLVTPGDAPSLLGLRRWALLCILPILPLVKLLSDKLAGVGESDVTCSTSWKNAFLCLEA